MVCQAAGGRWQGAGSGEQGTGYGERVTGETRCAREGETAEGGGRMTKVAWALHAARVRTKE